MGDLLSRGAAIVMISSELPEILGMSDRILVMRDGRIAGEFDRRDATEEKILSCALRDGPAWSGAEGSLEAVPS
jgi:ribose transport system ATP-binding protein